MSLRIFRVGISLVASLLIAAPVMAQDKPNEQAAKANPMGYFLGVSVGQQMMQQGFKPGDFDVSSMAAGVTDGLKKLEPALNDKQLQSVQGEIEKLLKKRQEEMLTMQKEKGVVWLKQNAKKEGVKVLEGGVQYKVLKKGSGGSPSASDTVKVHYTGKLISGKVFDSSVQRGEPAEFKVGQVIQGWQMALKKMSVGSKWMLYIPSELAYGERGSRGAIGPHETLVFEVELLEIK